MHVVNFQDLPQAFAGIVLHILTSSYSGAYAYHTVNPIEKIKQHQKYQEEILKDELIEALAYFRHIKSEELKFVSVAVSQSFSNPSIIWPQNIVLHNYYRLPYPQEL
jgi:hypothetical protein